MNAKAPPTVSSASAPGAEGGALPPDAKRQFLDQAVGTFHEAFAGLDGWLEGLL